jgi:hypothetical protein
MPFQPVCYTGAGAVFRQFVAVTGADVMRSQDVSCRPVLWKATFAPVDRRCNVHGSTSATTVTMAGNSKYLTVLCARCIYFPALCTAHDEWGWIQSKNASICYKSGCTVHARQIFQEFEKCNYYNYGMRWFWLKMGINQHGKRRLYYCN